jgi:Tfp pilus assembly protein PilF
VWIGSLLACTWLGPPRLFAAEAQETPAAAAGSSRALEEAHTALERGDAAAAEQSFRALVAGDPDLAPALLGRARALHALGRTDEAETSLLRAAERRLRRGADLEAISVLEEAMSFLPVDAGLLTLLGDARLRARQFVRAEEALGRAVALAPDPRRLHLLAAAQWENGRWDAAESTYRSLLETNQADAEARLQLGRLLAWQGRYEEALLCFERAAAQGHQGPELVIERARAIEGASRGSASRSDADRVAQAYAEASAAAPDDYQVRYGWARALRQSGADAEAARQMAEFERLYQEHQQRTRRAGLDEAKIELARERLRAEEPEAALRALEGVGATPDVHRLRALALVARGDALAARRELEAGLLLAPDRVDLRSLLSQLRLGESKP